jgi:spore coat polysaccharide biosynthesis protein SpsF
VVIQARMGSTRLPGKVLIQIGHSTLLGHVVGRLALITTRGKAVVATSVAPADDAIERWCAAHGIACWRGSEADVLGRYYGCARELGLDPIVRLTADNPFTDIVELDRLIAMHQAEGNAFTHSFGALPVGVGAEIFTFAALERSAREGALPHHREHVDEYMIENPALFRTGTLEVAGAKRRPDVRLTVDTEEDLRRARFVVEHATQRWVGTEEAIALCSRFA